GAVPAVLVVDQLRSRVLVLLLEPFGPQVWRLQSVRIGRDDAVLACHPRCPFRWGPWTLTNDRSLDIARLPAMSQDPRICRSKKAGRARMGPPSGARTSRAMTIPDDVAAFLGRHTRAFLLTRRRDGSPTIHPMTAFFADGRVTMTTYRKSAKARN